MEYELREWRLSDAADLAVALNDRRILDNLRDGLPYPYTEKDAEEYITAMLTADKNEVFACTIAVNGRAAGSITAFRQENIHRRTAALELCWRVFLEFEAPEYPAEGVAAFRASLDDKERTRSLAFYGAYDGEKLVGTLCMCAPQHIGGFFVDGGYHRRGIGRRLFEAMRRDYEKQEFTVNSSPYAVEIYKRLGFVQEDAERLSPEGLRYTPMRFTEGR